MCPPLTHPHVLVIYSSPGPSYSFGTRADYMMISCPEGTETRGGDNVRNCSGDGSSIVGVWSGAAPVCAGWQMLNSMHTLLYSIQYQINHSFCRFKEYHILPMTVTF